MILNIFAYKDNALGCYTQPFYDDRPVEHVKVGVCRAIAGAEHVERMKHKVLYKIGTFEDTTAKIETIEPELVVDCDEVIASLDIHGKTKQN